MRPATAARQKSLAIGPEPISMPTCRGCGEEHETDTLERHERDGLVIVHCPDCAYTMGTWRDPAARPVRDRRDADGGESERADGE